jgi:hypothetical protein
VPYPPCTGTVFWLKYQDSGRCQRRVTQPPFIAGPLGLKHVLHIKDLPLMKTLKLLFILVLIALLSFNSQAQIQIKILKSPYSIKTTQDSITVKVKFRNSSNKNYLLFFTRNPLPYSNPVSFYFDKWSPPTSIVVFTSSQNIEAEPKNRFVPKEVFPPLDYEVENKFYEEQSMRWKLQDNLIKKRIYEAETNPLLIPSKTHFDIKYSILTKDIKLDPGIYKIKIGYCCENFFRFDSTSRNKIKSQFKNAEIFIGTVYSKEKSIVIKE